MLVLHDFDAQGFSILGTFNRNLRRYTYENEIEVIDFGLRLDDVEALGLLSEPAQCKQTRERLIENGATKAEAEFIKAGPTLSDVSLHLQMRKPFDILAERPNSNKSRGDCRSFEPFR